MPRLTVKSAAELLRLPAYEHLRILHEQKYPQQQPQIFRTPYYAPARNAIRNYYQSGNDRLTLVQARAKIAQLGLPQRQRGNKRVVDAFERGSQSSRRLTPVSLPRTTVSVGEVEFSLSLDLLAHETGSARHIYYNFRTTAIDPEIAKAALDIAHWVLTGAGQDVPIGQLEYIDFANGKVYKLKNRRPATIRRLTASAKIIEALWATI
jgi:hypothetical protein